MRIGWLVAMTAILAGCGIDAHSYEKEFHQYYPLKSGGRLALENFNGSVEIRGWDQEKVEIDGVQYGSTPHLRDSIQTDVVANGDSVRIRTVLPSGFRGSMGVKYIIKAPRRLNLDRLVTTNGSLRLEDLEGLLQVRTSNGSIRALNIRGSLEATTSNGGIEARILHPEPHRPVRLTTKNGRIQLTMDSLDDNDVRAGTTNGSIDVKLPSQARARLRAQTSHGSIHSDFDISGTFGYNKNRLEGTIGGGGPTLDLSTTNGAIRLMKF